MNYFKSLFFCILILLAALSACTTDDPINEEMPLEFSLDTLTFDTVFTARGSSTRLFKIYNRSSQDIYSKIEFEHEQSFFRMNVDGVPATSFESVKIPAKDSIYVFMEVTVDPDQPLSVSPFVIYERLIFETEYARQSILLEAYGQNANYLTPQDSKGRILLLSCDMETISLDDPKPYILLGGLVVDSCTLRLPPGTRLYVHGGLVFNDDFSYPDGLLLIGANGRLIMEGTLDNPVIVEGDRLEPSFDDVAGQWNGIRFLSGSTGSHITHSTIKNAINAILVDSAASLRIGNSQILNNSNVGLLGRRAQIQVENSLIAIAGNYPVQISYGGEYTFQYCTIANYASPNTALFCSNFQCLDQLCQNRDFHPLNLSIRNSIISGNRDDEIALLDGTEDENDFHLDLSYNLVRVNDLLEDYPRFFDDCNPCWNYVREENLFQSPPDFNFQLDTLSQAADKGIYNNDIPTDIFGIMRDTETPDLGCFERILP